uniref:Uncharacterized protein n=1 Tax=Sphaerodactylus townsendi TaxID=933632 RepID=A0ACB8G4Q3_9SAUR
MKKSDKDVNSLNKVLARRCSCDISCFEDSSWSASEEQSETPFITWHSTGSTLVKSDKTFECSWKSLSGYNWLSNITAGFHPSERVRVEDLAKDTFSSLRGNDCITGQQQDACCIWQITYLKNIVFYIWQIWDPAHLNSEGLELKDIVLVHLYMKSMKDFSVINSAYMTTFDLCPPASKIKNVLVHKQQRLFLLSLDYQPPQSILVTQDVFKADYSVALQGCTSVGETTKAPISSGVFSILQKLVISLSFAAILKMSPKISSSLLLCPHHHVS